MKRINYFPFFIGLVIFMFSGCNTEDDLVFPFEFTVEPYDRIQIDGQVRILLNKGEANPDDYQIEILSTEEQRENITIVSENGLLTIEVDNTVVFDDEVTISLNTYAIEEIRLESNQKAEIIGFFDQENLKVVTEGASELILACVRVDNLTSVQEAASTFHLESWFEEIDEELIVPEENAILINDTTLLVDDSFLVIGENIILEGTASRNWIVYGDIVKRYYLISYANFKTEGNSYLNTLFAPIVDVSIKLEGSSEAMVWATERLSGKGEGQSILWYLGDPLLSDFVTQGEAQIIPIY